MTRRDVAAWSVALATVVAFAACSGGGGSPAPGGPSGTPTPGATATPTHAAGPTATPSPTHSGTATATPTPAATPIATATPTPTSSQLPGLNPRLTLTQSGFYGNTIASTIPLPRQLLALPNGDLLVGSKNTRGPYSPTTPCTGCTSSVYLIPGADGLLAAGTPVVFATVPDAEAQGVAYSTTSNMIYIASTFGVWEVPYTTGEQTAVGGTAPVKIVSVRTGQIAPNSDGDVHSTTSVTVSGNYLYIGVGSSCNRCAEVDPTRAVVLRTDLSGHNQVTVATRFRNAIALATNPKTGAVWAGGAGQDCASVTASTYGGNPFPTSCGAQDNAYATNGHPYEFMDHVSISAAASSNGTADYGWPDCEEDHVAYVSPSVTCTNVEPAVEAPAYSTIIGATFYPAGLTGAYAFPSKYGGGMFMSFHGSWHENPNGIDVAVPNMVFVPISGDTPVTPVNWNAPTAQWSAFLSSYQDNEGNRYGQPVGLAVGPQGSLFVADDLMGVIYRIRPGSAPAGAAHVVRIIH